MAEARVNGGVEPIDFVQLWDELAPRLRLYPNSPNAEEALMLLGNLNEHEVAYGECIEQARLELDDVADSHARTVKEQFCSQVYGSYPAGSEGAPELMSPRHFIREHGLDGRMRPELREAQALAISASRNRLVEEVRDDEQHKKLETVVDDEELIDGMKEEVQSRVDALRRRVDEIKQLMPIIKTPLGRVGTRVMSVMHYQRAVSVDVVTAPGSGKERAQLESAIFGLKTVLEDLLDGENVIAHTLAERYAGRVRDHLERELIGHYEKLEAAALARLPADIEAAYASAASLGPSYQPRSNANEQTEVAVAQPANSDERFPAQEDDQSVKIRTIRTANPFEWHRGESVEISILSQGGQVIIYGNAMTPNIQAISQAIRSKGSHAAKKLDDMWSRVIETERQGAAANHSLIRTIRSDFHDLSVRCFKNKRKNGLRTYYTKTQLSRFPALLRATESGGATASSELIILLAETDKAHQEKVLQELRAQWGH